LLLNRERVSTLEALFCCGLAKAAIQCNALVEYVALTFEELATHLNKVVQDPITQLVYVRAPHLLQQPSCLLAPDAPSAERDHGCMANLMDNCGSSGRETAELSDVQVHGPSESPKTHFIVIASVQQDQISLF
jgi:hypothetical protein